MVLRDCSLFQQRTQKTMKSQRLMEFSSFRTKTATDNFKPNNSNIAKENRGEPRRTEENRGERRKTLVLTNGRGEKGYSMRLRRAHILGPKGSVRWNLLGWPDKILVYDCRSFFDGQNIHPHSNPSLCFAATNSGSAASRNCIGTVGNCLETSVETVANSVETVASFLRLLVPTPL